MSLEMHTLTKPPSMDIVAWKYTLIGFFVLPKKEYIIGPEWLISLIQRFKDAFAYAQFPQAFYEEKLV